MTIMLMADRLNGQIGIVRIVQLGYGAAIGWIYIEGTGAINANCVAETDEAGVLYSTY